MVINILNYSFTKYSKYHEEKSFYSYYYENFTDKTIETSENQVILNYKKLLKQVFNGYLEIFRKIPIEIFNAVIKGLIKIVTLIKEELETEVSLSGNYIFSDLNLEVPLLFEIILLVNNEEKKKEKYIDKYEDLWLSIVPPEVDKYFILTVKWD